MVALDLFAELIWVRTSMYAYPGTIHGLSIWGGKWYQFPIYESVLWPMMWTAMGALKYFRDDKGRSVVERGVDRVKARRARRTPLRVLAIVGFANVAMIIYTIPMVDFSLHNDSTPRGLPELHAETACAARARGTSATGPTSLSRSRTRRPYRPGGGRRPGVGSWRHHVRRPYGARCRSGGPSVRSVN